MLFIDPTVDFRLPSPGWWLGVLELRGLSLSLESLSAKIIFRLESASEHEELDWPKFKDVQKLSRIYIEEAIRNMLLVDHCRQKSYSIYLFLFCIYYFYYFYYKSFLFYYFIEKLSFLFKGKSFPRSKFINKMCSHRVRFHKCHRLKSSLLS